MKRVRCSGCRMLLPTKQSPHMVVNGKRVCVRCFDRLMQTPVKGTA